MRREKLFQYGKRSGLIAVFGFILFLIIDYIFPFIPNPAYSRVIEDRNGKVIHAALTQDQQWRMYISLSKVNGVTLSCITEKEDQYFYYHPGINLGAIIRALYNNITRQKRTSGASTITMQTVRLYQPAPRTYLNKLIEMFKALQLEWHYSKNEILELYINRLPYGGNIQGIRTASVMYFGLEPAHLSLAQAALLAIIPNKPVTMRPGRNDAELVLWRNKWLNHWKNLDLFDGNLINDALAEPIDAHRRKAPSEMPEIAAGLYIKYPHQSVIKTTLKLPVYQKTLSICRTYMQGLQRIDIYNCAVVIIDNKTGELISAMGSHNYFDKLHHGAIDATLSMRSPGSTLKPFIYGMAMEKGLLTPGTVMYDVPWNFGGYEPENYHSRFSGAVTVSDALVQSLNIPAVKALEMVGELDFINRMNRCGTGWNNKPGKMGLSMALGACEISLRQLTLLYAALARKGKYISWKETLTDSTVTQPVYILDSFSAYMITQILHDSQRPELPEAFRNNPHLPNIAWKTGTSYGRRDAWSIGVSANYTIGVWVGNCNGKGAASISGGESAAPLMIQLFNALDYNPDASWIFPPRDIGFRLVCTKTGLPPGSYCEDQKGDFYIPGISTQQKCKHIELYKLSPDMKFIYCSHCAPTSGYIEKKLENTSPFLITYFQKLNINYTKIPPHFPGCHRIFEGMKPEIISPVNNKEYLLEHTGNAVILLKARTDQDAEFIYWYVNDKYVGACKTGEEIFVKAEEGVMRVSCSDDKGRKSESEIRIRFY